MIDRIVGHPDAAHLPRLAAIAGMAMRVMGERLGQPPSHLVIQFPHLNVSFEFYRGGQAAFIVCLN